MKRIAGVMLAGMFLICGLAAVALAQSSSGSLGDYARAVRKEKKQDTSKKFDNDNLPADNKLSVVGKAPAENAEAGSETQTDKNADAASDAKPADGDAKKDG